VHPERKDSSEADDFWEAVIGEGGAERMADGHFARGFAEGAKEVWELGGHGQADTADKCPSRFRAGQMS
jgi:hypothetical protein